MQFLSDATLARDPDAALKAATKQYVDGKVSGGAEVYAQPAAPAPGTIDVIWVDVDDTSMGADSGTPHTHTEYWKKWTGTQAEYDAIGTKDPNTLYGVVG